MTYCLYCGILIKNEEKERVMSIEVEIKLKINEKKSIEEKLAESGFQKGVRYLLYGGAS